MNMYKIYLKQAWALLKENKLLSGVSIFGTALAICMIMVIVIVWQMRTANYSPEDYRDRMMYVSDTRASYKENESYNDCYFLASRVVKDCFYPLRSAEKVGMAYHGVQRLAAVADHTVEFKCDVTFTDAAFWNIFNFHFLSGKPYGEEEVQSGIMDAVVSESVARRLYGTTEVVGRTVEISTCPIPSVPSCGMSPCWPSLPMAMSGCLIPPTIPCMMIVPTVSSGASVVISSLVRPPILTRSTPRPRRISLALTNHKARTC